MTSNKIPEILNYKSVKPRGMNTEFKTMRFTPLTSFNSYITNDIVRFWIPMIKGFWDPYQSYIQIEVEVDQADFPYGHAIQVDNSASSFINEMTIYADSKEIQRIQEYDTIAALLHDAMYKPGDKVGKEYEGTGYASHTSNGTSVDTRRTTNSNLSDGFRTVTEQYNQTKAQVVNGGPFAISNSTNVGNLNFDRHQIYSCGYFPQQPTYITPRKVMYPVASVLDYKDSPSTDITFSNPSMGLNLGGSGYLQFPRPNWAFTFTVDGYGFNGIAGGFYGNGVPAWGTLNTKCHPAAYQFLHLHTDNNSYQCVASDNYFYLQNKQLACGRPWVQSHLQSSTYGIQGTNSNNFSLYSAAGYADHNWDSTVSGGRVNVANLPFAPNYDVSTVKANGYSQAFSQELSNSSFQPLFAPGHKQAWIHNGKFQDKPVGTTKRVFQIPIISSIFGVLIPAESYKLLPMAAFKNLMLEFRLNEFAMFTSGYRHSTNNPAINTDLQSLTSQLQRQWKINKMEIWGAIYQFDDFVNAMTDSMLRTGITLCSSGWNIGPRFSLSNTALIQNTYQINAGYESLQNLCFRIQSDDYKKWTYCRKHYYYSGNITSLQIQIANTYIPPQPIEGNAGNIFAVGNQKSNAPFIIQLHKSFGQLFNIGSTMYINATNFAVNDRPYNPANTAPYRDPTTRWVQNIDTAHGLPLFHQNRCVGRALYAFDLQSIPGEPQVISGLDTTQWRPFQVQIDSSIPETNGRDATIIFILNYDVIYVLKSDSPPDVMGRGS